MDKTQFLTLMKFPPEWREWNLYPDELANIQIASYEPGNENGSEHDRNGAFHWWLKREPDKKVLEKLVRLSYLDPDQILGTDVRRHILLAKNCDDEVVGLIDKKKK